MEYGLYWDTCWQDEKPAELYKYLDSYYKMKSKEIDIFKAHNVKNVCDAACGFGAYSLAFASHGFVVWSFDISETAVEITKRGLEKYGIDSSKVKVASILDTGYQSEMYDGVIAHAVLDHLTVADANKALGELYRITRPSGLIMLSFDTAWEDDFKEEHIMLEDGSMQYTKEARSGMIFHPYDWVEIEAFLHKRNMIYKAVNFKNEKIVILQK